MKNVVIHLNINVLLPHSAEEKEIFFAPSYSSYEVLKETSQAVENLVFNLVL